MADLFSPLRVGSLELPNRIWMAPLTRCRAQEGHVPGPLIAEHYSQRATAGLIVAEATMAMEGNSAFWHEPGIYNEAQIEGWRLTTDAVHRAGGTQSDCHYRRGGAHPAGQAALCAAAGAGR